MSNAFHSNPALVLLNPHAGGGKVARVAAPMAQLLRSEFAQAALAQCHSVEQTQRMLADLAAPTRVVVVGGDGSVHHVLDAVRTAHHSMGLVPMGSANDTARALGVHQLSWQDALRLALTAAAARIDLGEVTTGDETARTSQRFVSSLAVGFDAAIALRAQRSPAWLTGLPRYLRATLQQLAHLSNQRIEVVVDGRPVHNSPALFASTLNTRTYGSGMPAVPSARIDDGLLDLIVAGQFSRLQVLWLLPKLLAGKHLPHARISTHMFKTLQLTAPQPLDLAADGEPVGSWHTARVCILPGALQAVRAVVI